MFRSAFEVDDLRFVGRCFFVAHFMTALGSFTIHAFQEEG